MEHRRHIVPSSYPPHQFPLGDASGLLRGGARHPLTNSAGNSQLQALASVGHYHENKGLRSRANKPMYPTPTVPSSLPSHQSVGQTLEQRRQSHRKRRLQRLNRNPFADSPQYQAYRKRQLRDRNGEDSKWPEVLEAAFLDALIEIPLMGRSKYSYKGKLHGRNELIVEYLWIAYLQSLPPGQPPDPSMMRDRKQVSSHIQVIKGFLKGHPAYHKLFPEAKDKKALENKSFKDDPCLRAISEGRLPNTRYDRYKEYNDANQEMVTHHPSMKPTHFWLLITSTSIPSESNGRDTKEDLYANGMVAHQCTALESQRPSDSLESIPNWRIKFPQLQRLYSSGELRCDIIHMDVSLKLMSAHPPEGAELISRTELSIPRGELDSCVWQIVTTLIKPPELCRDSAVDPPVESQPSWIQVLSVSEEEARIKVPFPANPWAHAFTNLADVQLKHEEKQAALHGSRSRSAREYVRQISMYQEVQSSSGPGTPFTRRAIILWTFRKASSGESNGSTYWRYLHPSPPRQTLMSPGPHPSHHISATMNEHFSTFMETPLQLHTQLQRHSDMIGTPFIHQAHAHTGLATPPNTVGLHSPFGPQQFGFPSSPLHQQSFDLPPENLSFSSTTTTESDSTLVETGHPGAASNLDHFLTNTGVHLGSYEDHTNGVNHEWNITVTESYDTDSPWAGYEHVVDGPAPHIGSWDVSGPTGKSHCWTDSPDLKNHDEWPSHDVVIDQEKYQLEWMSEDHPGHIEGHDWAGGAVKEKGTHKGTENTRERTTESRMEQEHEQDRGRGHNHDSTSQRAHEEEHVHHQIPDKKRESVHSYNGLPSIPASPQLSINGNGNMGTTEKHTAVVVLPSAPSGEGGD